MKKNSNKLHHALHNEAVCDHLELTVEFADWTITTAFYAALQFVNYKVFPFEAPTINGKKTKIECLDDYYRYKNERRISKHELLADLVEKHCDSISPDYDWLLSMSMTARYSGYLHDKMIADKARRLMKNIKKFCFSQKLAEASL
ncbi:hypothetical protein QEG73_04035 [Chitinophagaceae bacterium 26-R-25]|nr:hypothetical protein [Chitinophagaceae bacterium 26-R-25]